VEAGRWLREALKLCSSLELQRIKQTIKQASEQNFYIRPTAMLRVTRLWVTWVRSILGSGGVVGSYLIAVTVPVPPDLQIMARERPRTMVGSLAARFTKSHSSIVSWSFPMSGPCP
jgi:hypothetical protein